MTTTMPLKRVAVSSVLESQPQFAPAIEAANHLLSYVVGRSAQFVEADWDVRRQDNGHSAIRLTLKEADTGDVYGEFSTDEFQDETHLQRRLYSLWSELLAKRSEKQLRELRAAVQRLEEN